MELLSKKEIIMSYASKKIFLVGFFSLVLVASSFAATKGRIMTNGKVTMYQNGRAVASYTDQGPLDENSLIGCNGSCMVKMQGIAMNAADQTTFAVKEQGSAVNLYVEKGQIYFVMSDLSHQFNFYTPDGYFVKTEGFIAPASAENSVKGFVRVTDKATEIGMNTGVMIVTTDEGTQTIEPGQSIVLAMADVPPAGGQATNDPRGGAAFWEGLSDSQRIGVIALGTGTAAGGVAILKSTIWDNSSGAGGRVGPPGPPPQASPNR